MRLTTRKASRHQNRRSQTKRGLRAEPLEGRKLLAAAIMDAASMDTALDVQTDQPAAIVAGSSSSMQHDSSPIAYIVNGQQTSDHHSVGIVNGGCTGTLISPTHVLTAAHCVEGNGSSGFIGDREGTFDVGGETYRTQKVTVHPKYNINDFGAGFDLAIMELDRPVEGITPSKINRTAPTVGQELTLVGFGEAGTTQNPSHGFGTKHVGTSPIDSITNEHISWTLDNASEAATAPGDSGGPAFVNVGGELVVAGVTSGGSGDAHAIGAESFDTRIDTLASWIDAQVGSTTPGDDNPGDDNSGDDGGSDTGDDDQFSPIGLATQELDDYDANEDGSLSVSELTSEFQDYGLSSQEAKTAARDLRDQFDEDGDGELSLSELVVSWGGNADDVTDSTDDGGIDDGGMDDGGMDDGGMDDGGVDDDGTDDDGTGDDFEQGSPEQLAADELSNYDADGDDALSLSELTDEFREMGYGNGEATGIAQDLVQVFDTDGDQQLDFSELVVSWGGQADDAGDGIGDDSDDGDLDDGDFDDGSDGDVVDDVGDGETSIAAQQAAEELALYDTNNNGKLSKKELKTQFLDMGMSHKEAKAVATDLLDSFDSDGDNQLSLAELTESWGGSETEEANDPDPTMDETSNDDSWTEGDSDLWAEDGSNDDFWAEDTDWLEQEIELFF